MDELELAIACGPDHKCHRKLNAMHLLIIGVPFELVVRNSLVDERTVRSWVRRFNERGIDGLAHRPGAGRPRLLEHDEIEEKVLPVVEDPSLADEHHWTARKLCGWLNDTLETKLSYSTVVRYLHEHDYKRKIPRPMPEPSDPEKWEQERETFIDELLELLEEENSSVFFGDEAGFEGDPRPRQKWVKRGSHPTQGYYGGHIRQNVVGAVNPQDGQLVSLIVPHNDREVFQAFLDTMAEEVPDRGKDIWLVLDNASWHHAKSLNWHHIQPLFLPPYSPDLNPIERLWQHLKSNYLAGFITKYTAELSDKLESSIRDLLKQPDKLQSVCQTHSE